MAIAALKHDTLLLLLLTLKGSMVIQLTRCHTTLSGLNLHMSFP